MRDRRLELWTLLLVTLVGAFAWLTRHPDAAIVGRAERWPWIGPVATAFRERWNPPAAPPPPPAAPPVVEYVYLIESDGPTPGRPAAPRRAPAARSRPAAPVATSGQAPVLPGAPRAAEPALVERARELLRGGGEARAIGGYMLLTDVRDEALFERWRQIVRVAEPAWRERYGLAPLGTPAESIALFASAGAFRELQRSVPTLGALDANGFTFGGLVALATERMSDEQLDGTLQHELAHLLTRRSIGPALPAWLAEGLAEDFGQAPLAAAGLDFDGVRGSVTRAGNRFELRGGIAFFDRLERLIERGALPTPLDLARLDDAEFSGGESGLDHYAAAFAWTRFLLAAPPRSSAFRRFLASVAAGEMPTAERLEAEVGATWRALQPELRAWLVELRDRCYRRAGVPLGPRWRTLDEVPPAELPGATEGGEASGSIDRIGGSSGSIDRIGGTSGSIDRIGGTSGSIYRIGGTSGSSSRHPAVPSA